MCRNHMLLTKLQLTFTRLTPTATPGLGCLHGFIDRVVHVVFNVRIKMYLLMLIECVYTAN